MFGSGFDKIEQDTKGIVLNIEHFHVHDGEGIRTNIFLKGCTLHCPWCCNPESINPKPQIAQHRNLCTDCGRCISACPEGCCVRKEDGNVVTDFSKCLVCGKCVEVCPVDAREIFGKKMSVAEVMDEVEKDSLYFLNSDGGITLSGGEACMQPKFASEIAKAAHRRYIPVALETAACVPWNWLWQVIGHVDEVLMDLKTTPLENIDKKIGKNYLEIVLNNLKLLRKHDIIVTLRCPVVPKYNDTLEHIRGIATIAKEVNVEKIDLLPFHQYGKYKYASIGKEYQLEELPEMDWNKVEKMAEVLRQDGFLVSVGG